MALRIEDSPGRIVTEPFTFGGKEIGLLARRFLLTYARQVSGILALNPRTMLYVPEDELYFSMIEGRSSLITDLGTDNLVAYARTWELPNGDMEIGTWVSKYKGGFGKSVFKRMIQEARVDYSGKRLVAAAEWNNSVPQQIITAIGGKYIRTRKSPTIVTVTGQKATMIEYDVTLAGM